MHPRHLNKRPAAAAWLLGLALSCPAMLLANVFGDGDPGNGSEDDRRVLSGVHAPPGRWREAVGTIHCDGALRGSAVVLDLGPQAGAVLATAAHVLRDPEAGTAWRECRFHLQGMDRVPGWQWPLPPPAVRAGAAPPDLPLHDLRLGEDDWAFLRVPGDFDRLARASGVRPRAWAEVAGEENAYFVVGWDDARGRLSASGPCTVRESGQGDLGGGAWPGQLLDDCDSGPGASGGGLLAQTPEGVFLVGIRTGAHWDGGDWPAERWPAGPPDGARWDVRTNTNFARALDARLLGCAAGLARGLAQVSCGDH